MRSKKKLAPTVSEPGVKARRANCMVYEVSVIGQTPDDLPERLPVIHAMAIIRGRGSWTGVTDKQ